jgi:hypothetical protein
MTRKLLPYEYELIDALGVSKEEYLDFVAQQHIYKDIKARQLPWMFSKRDLLSGHSYSP